MQFKYYNELAHFVLLQVIEGNQITEKDQTMLKKKDIQELENVVPSSTELKNLTSQLQEKVKEDLLKITSKMNP